MKARIQELESLLSKVSGISIDITFRGSNKFTFSYEGEDMNAFSKIQDYFKREMEYDYDEECDMTFLYVEF